MYFEIIHHYFNYDFKLFKNYYFQQYLKHYFILVKQIPIHYHLMFIDYFLQDIKIIYHSK
jgi:hypothetical protein